MFGSRDLQFIDDSKARVREETYKKIDNFSDRMKIL